MASTPQHISSPFLLLILSHGLLLLLDSSELQCIGSVSSRDNVAVRAVCAADLAARPSRFVNECARGAWPTLWGGWLGAECFTELRHLQVDEIPDLERVLSLGST